MRSGRAIVNLDVLLLVDAHKAGKSHGPHLFVPFRFYAILEAIFLCNSSRYRRNMFNFMICPILLENDRIRYGEFGIYQQFFLLYLNFFYNIQYIEQKSNITNIIDAYLLLQAKL